MAGQDTTRAPSDALTRPIDRIRWAADTAPRDELAVFDTLRPTVVPWYRRRSVIAAAVVTAVLAGGVAAAARASAEPELGPPPRVHEVVRGDTLWAISRDNGLTLAELLELNPDKQANPNLIEVGERIVVEAPPVAVNEVQRVAAGPDVSKWRGEMETCTAAGGVQYQCLTWRAIVAELWLAGFRDDDLVTMAAISPCEGGRAPFQVNETYPDRDLSKGHLGSYGTFQIQAHADQTGTGGPRDRDALLASFEHQAWAAHEVYLAAQASERPGVNIVPVAIPQGGGRPAIKQAKRPYSRFDPWTCFQIRRHEPFLEVAAAAAVAIGVR